MTITIDFNSLDAMSKDERLSAIDDALHALNFERRMTLLTDKQREHMTNESISDEAKAKLNSISSPEQREQYIQGLARAIYFKRMAWSAYLNGDSDTPPIPAD